MAVAVVQLHNRQHTNTPALQHASKPTHQRNNRPTHQHINIPAHQHKKTFQHTQANTQTQQYGNTPTKSSKSKTRGQLATRASHAARNRCAPVIARQVASYLGKRSSGGSATVLRPSRCPSRPVRLTEARGPGEVFFMQGQHLLVEVVKDYHRAVLSQ